MWQNSGKGLSLHVFWGCCQAYTQQEHSISQSLEGPGCCVQLREHGWRPRGILCRWKGPASCWLFSKAALGFLLNRSRARTMDMNPQGWTFATSLENFLSSHLLCECYEVPCVHFPKFTPHFTSFFAFKIPIDSLCWSSPTHSIGSYCQLFNLLIFF